MCKCENVQMVAFVRAVIKNITLFSHLHINYALLPFCAIGVGQIA